MSPELQRLMAEARTGREALREEAASLRREREKRPLQHEDYSTHQRIWTHWRPIHDRMMLLFAREVYGESYEEPTGHAMGRWP